MRKRMFNDTARLTQAVLEGRKTMTRSEIPSGTILKYGVNRHTYKEKTQDILSDPLTFRIGEELAVARCYREVIGHIQTRVKEYFDYTNHEVEAEMQRKAGWNNKMFVKAEWMPDIIIICEAHIERLQDISEDDCIREGVVRREDGLFSDGFTDTIYKDARTAFRSIAETAMEAGIWERNPFVIAYGFRLKEV